jgi:hypothetical protein
MRKRLFDISYLLFCITLVLFIIYGFTGNWPWKLNPYNSYTLQALSWLDGRLDLGQNYSYLELAIYSGKYYVSFPSFPSYVMLPFAFFFGEHTPDGIIAFMVALIGAVYGLKLFWVLRKNNKNAIFWVLFLFVGTNALFVMVNGWVWFFAQNLCFTLSIMTLYYAKRGKGGMALFLWACSVGCRPLQVIYLPVILYILYKEVKEEYPEDDIFAMVKRKYMWVLPTVMIAVSYMLLNYGRFGNIFEFGHNYLPEFIQANHGQFHISYIKENLINLLRLPGISDAGWLEFYQFNGMAFWLVSPIYISYFFYLIRRNVILDKKPKEHLALNWMIPILILIHMIMLMSHKTMGGWHFGNRYINDTLPYVFYGILLLLPEQGHRMKVHYALFTFGLILNVVGTIALYGGWL